MSWQNKRIQSIFIDLMTLKVEGKWYPLVTAIWQEICIHSNHQQRCENYVQLSGLLALTGVSEDRRSCRAISVAAIIRRFNQWALGEWNKRKAAEDPPLPPVAKVQGAPKNMLFFEFLDDFLARGEVEGDKCKTKQLQAQG